MTDLSLRAILEAAETDLDTYRDPDVSDAVARLSEILVAAGYDRLRSGEMTVLRVLEKSVYIRIEYNAKGCDCDATYEFPVAIIDAPDPVKAATRWRLETRHAEVTRHLEEAKRLQGHWGTVLEGIEAEMAAA